MFIANKLLIQYSSVREIKTNHGFCIKTCTYYMVEAWLKQSNHEKPNPTWKVLFETLQKFDGPTTEKSVREHIRDSTCRHCKTNT